MIVAIHTRAGNLAAMRKKMIILRNIIHDDVWRFGKAAKATKLDVNVREYTTVEAKLFFDQVSCKNEPSQLKQSYNAYLDAKVLTYVAIMTLTDKYQDVVHYSEITPYGDPFQADILHMTIEPQVSGLTEIYFYPNEIQKDGSPKYNRDSIIINIADDLYNYYIDLLNKYHFYDMEG